MRGSDIIELHQQITRVNVMLLESKKYLELRGG